MPPKSRIREAEAVCKYWEVCPTSTYMALLLKIGDSTSYWYAQAIPYFKYVYKAYIHEDLWSFVLRDVESAVARLQGKGQAVYLSPADVIEHYEVEPFAILNSVVAEALKALGGQLAKKNGRYTVFMFARGQAKDRGGHGLHLRLLAQALRKEYWPPKHHLAFAALEKAKALSCGTAEIDFDWNICIGEIGKRCIPPEAFIAKPGCP